jgi:hypothetical protein
VKDMDLFQYSACGYPVFPAPFVKETVFSPMHILASFVKNQMTEDVWIYF